MANLTCKSIAFQLNTKLAILPGGLDREGRPIVVIPSKKESQRDLATLQDLAVCLNYLAIIPSRSLISKGFTAIIDLRGSSWKETKPLISTISDCLETLRMVLIIKPEDFWEKKRSSMGYRLQKQQQGFQTILLSTVSKLNQFIDLSQLTQDLGGMLPYDHRDWVDLRQKFELFLELYEDTLRGYDELKPQLDEPVTEDNGCSLAEKHDTLRSSIMSLSERSMSVGEEVLNRLILPGDPLPDQPKAAYAMDPCLTEMETLMNRLKDKQLEILDTWEEKRTKLHEITQFYDYETDYNKVLDWITGKGLDFLRSSNDIGDSLSVAETLKQGYDAFDQSAKEYMTLFVDLRERCRRMIEADHKDSRELKHRGRYLETMYKSFVDFKEKKRELLGGSVKFHRHAREFARQIDDLLDFLCTETETSADDVETADALLHSLNTRLEDIKSEAEQVSMEGNKLIGVMTDPVYSATGQNITPDYEMPLKHIERLMLELADRKTRSDELCEVRKLKLQQCLQLRTCERDAEQAVDWLQELYSVMVDTHTDLGRDRFEVEHLINEHKKFESTAQGTFEYGKQLLSAALVLRRSCRYDLIVNHKKTAELNATWEQFSLVLGERSSRLSMAHDFHTLTDQAFSSFDQLAEMSVTATTPRRGTAQTEPLDHLRQNCHREFEAAMHQGAVVLDMLRQSSSEASPTGTLDSHRNDSRHDIEAVLSQLREKQQQIDVMKDRGVRWPTAATSSTRTTNDAGKVMP